MSKTSSGLFMGTTGARIGNAPKARSASKKPASGKPVNPNDIRYSQTSVNGSKKVVESMKQNGWQGDPIDVVSMDDGKLTTLDNTRVIAARVAGIDVKANIHGYDDPLPDQTTKDRFTTPRGGVPQTWGQTVENRIGRQSSSFRRNNPRGSYNMKKIN